jgi:hypothetical protein
MKPLFSVDPEDPAYEQEYHASVKKVMNAFKNDQLREFLNSLKYDGKSPSTRRELTEILLNKSWGWVTPAAARKLVQKQVEYVHKGILYLYS